MPQDVVSSQISRPVASTQRKPQLAALKKKRNGKVRPQGLRLQAKVEEPGKIDGIALPVPKGGPRAYGYEGHSDFEAAEPIAEAKHVDWSVAKVTDEKYDGCILGANRKIFAADTPFDKIPTVKPDNGKPIKALIVDLNGCMVDVARHADRMQKLANEGYAVLGVHNSTHGMMGDVFQVFKDKLDMGNNKAVDTVTRILRETLGKQVIFIGHSQGALVLSRATKRIEEELLNQGLSEDAISCLVGTNPLFTANGAACTHAKLYKKTHGMNVADWVPWVLGAGNPMFSHPDDKTQYIVFFQIGKMEEAPKWNEPSNKFFRYMERTHGPTTVYPRLLDEPSKNRYSWPAAMVRCFDAIAGYFTSKEPAPLEPVMEEHEKL